MKADSKIIARLESYGPVCTWQGDERHGTATLDGAVLRRLSQSKGWTQGAVVKWGGLRLRVFGMVVGLNGCGADLYYVKLDNPHSQLFALYRERAERLVRFMARLEAAFRVFKGQMAFDVETPLSTSLASRLL
jgi:hypothetical protein